METIKIQYIPAGTNVFYRFSSLNGDRIRDIRIKGRDVDRNYRALFFELRNSYPRTEVKLEFVGDFPIDEKRALENLALIHNRELERIVTKPL